MGKDFVTNFASSVLVSPSPLTSTGTSFTITTGQGALFPTSNFLVTIDAEILLIASRASDTFTVGQRGYDNTVAASHSVGAVVQLSYCAHHTDHLWQNVADTFTPEVPPLQLATTPSSWDNEFEAQGGWTLYPTSASSGSIWNINSSLRSHLLLDRGSSDNTIYTAYTAFTPPTSQAFQLTMKIMMAIDFSQSANTNNQLQAYFFVSDQTNPTTGSGNRFYVKVQFATNVNTSGASPFANAYNYAYALQVYCGTASVFLTPALMAPLGHPLFLRLYSDGSGNYQGYLGDGLVYHLIARTSGLGFTPQSLGIQLVNYVPNGAGFPGTYAIDYIRVVTGTAASTPRFG